MGTHPIFESDFDCLTDKKVMPLKSKRFSRRNDARKATGIGVSKEELDEVLCQQKDAKDQPDGQLQDAINTSIQNRDKNEPVNEDAVKAEYVPTKTVTRRQRYSQKESDDRESKETSPYSLKSRTYSSNNNEQQKFVEPSSESEDEPPQPANRVGQQAVGQNETDDLLLEIENLEDKIQELQLQLKQKDTIIAEKDLEINRLKRSARQRTRQPRQSDF